jgi:hypothetical protein
VHRSRDERAWWRQAGIDPIKVARRLWKETHGIGERRSQEPALTRPHDTEIGIADGMSTRPFLKDDRSFEPEDIADISTAALLNFVWLIEARPVAPRQRTAIRIVRSV